MSPNYPQFWVTQKPLNCSRTEITGASSTLILPASSRNNKIRNSLVANSFRYYSKLKCCSQMVTDWMTIHRICKSYYSQLKWRNCGRMNVSEDFVFLELFQLVTRGSPGRGDDDGGDHHNIQWGAGNVMSRLSSLLLPAHSITDLTHHSISCRAQQPSTPPRPSDQLCCGQICCFVDISHQSKPRDLSLVFSLLTHRLSWEQATNIWGTQSGNYLLKRWGLSWPSHPVCW